MTSERIGFSRDQESIGSIAIGALFVVAAVVLVAYTRRIELGAVVALPLVLLLVSNFRLAATVTIWVALVWLLRIPAVFFDLVQFSYVLYACIALTLGAYLLRLGMGERSSLSLVTNKWTWLLIATIVAGGVHGAQSVGTIPTWVLAGSDTDLGVPWTYYRTVVFPGVLLPVLALVVGVALYDKQKLGAIMAPVWTLVCALDVLIIGQVATSGDALSVMATQRNEHLVSLGFHSNELGAFLAIAYGLGLGVWDGTEQGRSRTALGGVLAMTALAVLLTFSRGAYLALAVITVVVLMKGAPRKRLVVLCATALLLFSAPAPLLDRIGYGVNSRDVNEISAGRVDNLWVPLLPDIADHLWFGQGLQSIMWTDAQQFQEIFPASLAHNAFLDLILDFGVIGSLPIVAWYSYTWRGFRRGARTDPDARYRALFAGSELALFAFLLSSLTNNRLNPTATNSLLWIAVGILLARTHKAPERASDAQAETARQRFWRPLVRTQPVPSRMTTVRWSVDMCGITGFFSSTGDMPSWETALQRAVRALHHRGPDAGGVWVGDGVGLGHRRLSILDLSEQGRQPESRAVDAM